MELKNLWNTETCAEVKSAWDYTSTPQICVHFVVVNQARDVPRLGMRGAIPPLPQYVYMS
jgi:hypothetical protein